MPTFVPDHIGTEVNSRFVAQELRDAWLEVVGGQVICTVAGTMRRADVLQVKVAVGHIDTGVPSRYDRVVEEEVVCCSKLLSPCRRASHRNALTLEN